MSKRNEVQFKNYRNNTQQSQEPSQSQSSQGNRKKGTRSRLKSLLKQCAEMLRIMGVCYVQSIGEAEALCAQLNNVGVVDGCISQDGDCFLYGATTVYRNFTISATAGSHSSGFSVDVYKMANVREKLGLDRERMVALSLLCGCDYGQGVAGIGKQMAQTFLDSVGEGDDVLERFRRWRTDPYFERVERERVVLTTASMCDNCCHTGKQAKHDVAGCKECGSARGCVDNLPHRILTFKDPEERKVLISELSLRKKALQDPEFPSQDMIDEFLAIRPPPETLDIEWKEPNLAEFVKFSVNLLSWTDTYAVEKFLPLATRWQLMSLASKEALALERRLFSVTPLLVVKTRVYKGVASYEVRWTENTGLFDWLTLDEGVTEEDLMVTVEPQSLVTAAYPALVNTFVKEQEAKKKAKKKPTKKKAVTESVEESFKQTKISQFLKPTQPLRVQDTPELNNLTGHDLKLSNLTSGASKVSNPNDSGAVMVHRKKAVAVKKKPQVTIASLMKTVQIIEANKANAARLTAPPTKTSAKQSGKRNIASPRFKVGLKTRKIPKINSTPKKITSDALAELEMSFHNISLIDYEDDDDEFSDLSAIIDGIVGHGYDEVDDSFEIRKKYRTRVNNSIADIKENVVSTLEKLSNVSKNLNIDTDGALDITHKRNKLGNNLSNLIVRDKENVVPIAAANSDSEEDEFDLGEYKYVPLYERLKAQTQDLKR